MIRSANTNMLLRPPKITAHKGLVLAIRNNHSFPPVKSYRVNKSPIDLIWNYKIPLSAKYFSGLLAGSYGLTHVHPNVLVTLGPPVIIGSYIAYRYYHKTQFEKLFNKIKPKNIEAWENESDSIRIERYDEQDIGNVIQGVENEFDNFRAQIMQLTETRILDYISNIRGHSRSNEEIVKLFIDENDQFNINLDDSNIETFINIKVEAPKFDLQETNHITDFIKLSTPFYSSKDIENRERLGIVSIYLLEVPQEGKSYQEFKIMIEIEKYSIINKHKLIIKEIPGGKVYKSDKLLKKKDKQEEYEEITVNI